MTIQTQPISPEFPFESRFVEVHGSRMHYIDEGSGDPILFLHGNPTSSYLWRNVVPYLVPHGRCIAPDLIGMGKSDKPALDYGFLDHSRYLEGFVEALGLTNVTLVVHDWGSALGFHYATRHADDVRAVAFMESIVRPFTRSGKPADLRAALRLFRAPLVGWLLVSVLNLLVRQTLPRMIVRKLSPDEKRRYAAPYPTIRSRKPVRRWPREIPIDGRPAEVHEIVSRYSEALQASELPKLLLWAKPGILIDAAERDWCEENLRNLEVAFVGEGLHVLQEDVPHRIGEALAKWVSKLREVDARPSQTRPTGGS